MKELRLTIAIAAGVLVGMISWTYVAIYFGGIPIRVHRFNDELTITNSTVTEQCGTKDAPCHINIDKPQPTILFNPD